jgi:glycosyltransferase involved in cell wall biosynthesis
MSEAPIISTVLLSFNRINLLKKTLNSYLSTISVPYELIIVDNASSDGCREVIKQVSENNPKHVPILLDKPTGGGEAINMGVELTRGKYIHISENDIEYFPGWDREMIRKFEAFPDLGQISPKSLSVGAKQIAKPLTNGADTILTVEWITTTSLFRREIWDTGERWVTFEGTPEAKHKTPHDVGFSWDVRKLGYLVAWNDKNMVFNWGFKFSEILENIEYYVENFKSNPASGLDKLRKRLRDKGYELVEKDGRYKAVPINQTGNKYST